MLNSSRSEFVELVSFDLDPFQERSLDLFDRGESVLVAAPTGSGKTVVGLYGIYVMLRGRTRAFYTTPLKALSNQKYLEFCTLFGTDQVGLLTGDNTINAGANVVVMTTEVLRNMIYAESQDLSEVGLVVLDEVHYLQNPYRGSVWEEVIIHLPLETRLICLSATVSNAEEFASWMKTVRGSMEAVIEETRPVELEHLYAFGSKYDRQVHLMPTFIDGKVNPEGSGLDPPWLAGSLNRRGARPKAFQPKRSEIVDVLAQDSMLPAIYFIFSRAGCDEAAREVLHTGVRLTSKLERAQIREIVDEHLEQVSNADLHALKFKEFMACLEAGIAPHHAGMVPPFREIVEACFARALIKVVFATETLSLGINMPARTVVIDRLVKFNGERHEMLTGGDYTQLAGRAGRRGLDEFGYCVVLWNASTTFGQAASLAQTRSYPISSSFRPTYNMAANLIRRYDQMTAKHLLNLSFAQFGVDAEVVELEAELARVRLRLEEAQEDANCEYGDVGAYLDGVIDAERPRPKTLPHHVHPGNSLRLDRLRVGDVISVPKRPDDPERTRLVIVGIGNRGRANIKLIGVATTGKAFRLGVNRDEDIRHEGDVALPKPYLPNSKEFKLIAASLLREYVLPHVGEGEPELRDAPGHPTARRTPELRALEVMLSQCPKFTSHLSAARRVSRFRARLEDIARKIHAKQESLALQLDRVLEVLAHDGFVDGWSLLDRGERLSRIYCESDLLCAIALERGLLDGLEPPALAAIVSFFTYESRPSFRDGMSLPSKAVAQRAKSIKRAWSELVELETYHRLVKTREPDTGFAVPMFRWAKGYDLTRTLDGLSIPPGDFVRSVKSVVDLLRQLGEVAPDPATRQAAKSAIDHCLRGVVAVSSQVYRSAAAAEEEGIAAAPVP